jgi:HlyD family secretion protein
LPASESIYRRAALERISSPEQLDQTVGLTSPLSWLAVAALSCLMISALIWSLVGSLPISVSGTGILVTQGGQLIDAMAPASGSLTSVTYIGKVVHKGDIIANLDDTELKSEIDRAQAVLQEREVDLGAIKSSFERQITAKTKNAIAQKANFEEIIRTDEKRRDFYRDYLAREESAVTKGFISQRSLEETRREMEQAEQEAGAARSELLRLDAEELELGVRRDHEVLIAEQAMNEARRQVDSLTLQLNQGTRIISTQDGVVTELKATPGSIVQPGKPILSIETGGKGLQLLLYIPPRFGKEVKPGMAVQIEPATVRKEEFGTLLGRVLSVSDFPVTEEGITSELQNQHLAEGFMAAGPPYAARIELIADPATPSGFRWSGGRGPTGALSSGTTASATITIARRTPITFVLPILKGWIAYGD